MNKDYTKLKDFAQKRLDDSCENGNDYDIRYWVGYIDGLNALHKKLCGSEEALEKQIPKKPKDDGWLYCPICGRDVLMDRFNYCPDCGQALDWSDDNA